MIKSSPARILASITIDETTISKKTNCFNPFILHTSINNISINLYIILENVWKKPNKI